MQKCCAAGDATGKPESVPARRRDPMPPASEQLQRLVYGPSQQHARRRRALDAEDVACIELDRTGHARSELAWAQLRERSFFLGIPPNGKGPATAGEAQPPTSLIYFRRSSN